MSSDEIKVTEGSGNVFEDLGLPQPRERQAKATIALHIERLIDAAGWTQAEAAKRMGLAQPDVSNIVNGRLKGFTLERLFVCLSALDQEVQVVIRSHSGTDTENELLVTF